MLRLDELRAEIKGEFFLRENLKDHHVKKVEAVADVIIKPTGKKDFAQLLRQLQKSGEHHIVINSKGQVIFPDRRFHGTVVVTDFKL